MPIQFPIPSTVVDAALQAHEIADVGRATIREISSVMADIEKATGIGFMHLEIGIPSLAPSLIGIQSEIEALRHGAAEKYPPLDGVTALKHQSSRFFKAFVDIQVDEAGCLATVGSMQGSYAAFLLACQLHPKKQTILFLDPGFPVHKQQAIVMGCKIASFDVYEHRGVDFGQKLEDYFSTGDIAAVIYSNPNNPSWICFNSQELETIGRLAQQYDVLVIEDLAYFAMDFRHDYGKPFQPPYQPSVAKYCDNYVVLFSSSKLFSYAGQRVAIMAIADKLFHRQYDALKQRYGIGEFGHVMVQRILYTLSAGASHSAQLALAAMLKASSDGKFDFLDTVREYGDRAKAMKRIFLDQGFEITYPLDLETPIADGFYFTVNYPGMTAVETQYELLRFGISAISLYSAGCQRQGVRVCVSQIKQEQLKALDERLAGFAACHPQNNNHKTH